MNSTRYASLWKLGLIGMVLSPVIAGFVFHSSILAGLGAWLDIGKPPQPTDSVMILSGDSDVRPFVGAALVKTGFADKVLVTESLPPAGSGPAEHEVSFQMLAAAGLAADQVVLLEGACENTYDEARSLRRFLATHPLETITVVTSEYHTRRADWIFRQVLETKADQVHFVSAPTDRFDANNWWRNAQGMRFYLSEYIKLGFYWVRYGNARYFLAGIAFAIAGLLLWGCRHWKKNYSSYVPRRARIAGAAVVLLCFLLWLIHPWLLANAAQALIIEHEIQKADCALVLGGNAHIREAARLYHNHQVDRLVLVESRRNLKEQLGIFMPRHQARKRQLVRHGVPAEDIIVITGQPRGIWESSRQIKGWLAQNPSIRSVVCLRERFKSAWGDYVLRSVLEPEVSVRLQTIALPDRRYNEKNWWQSRVGLKEYFNAATRYWFARLHGPSHENPAWNPQEFERELQTRALAVFPPRQ